MFTLINLARWYNFDPEDALASTNQKFLDRFGYIEKALKTNFSDHSYEDLTKQWQQAKANIHKEIN